MVGRCYRLHFRKKPHPTPNPNQTAVRPTPESDSVMKGIVGGLPHYATRMRDKMFQLERQRDELREAFGDVETTLRHCRLFITDRKGYQGDEQKERLDITSSIDTTMGRITALKNTEPKE